MADIPAGFALMETGSPFILTNGPFYYTLKDLELTLGLLVEERHCNSAGRMHGGMVSTMADIALGNSIGQVLVGQGVELGQDQDQNKPTSRIVTVSMSTDFVGMAQQGDWVETRVDVQRVGKSLAFANAYLVNGEIRIARISAVFKVFEPRG